MFVVGAGLLCVLVALLGVPSHDRHEVYLSVPLLVLGSLALWWLVTKRSLDVAERFGYTVLALWTVSHVVVLSILPPSPRPLLNSEPYWNLICVLTLGFLAFPPWRAWPLNLGLTAVCLALPWLTQNAYALQNAAALFRLQCSVVVMLLLLGTLSALRRQVDVTGEAEQAMRVLAFTDSLTALPNRRAVYPAIEDLIQASGRGRAGALLLIDIDHFKKINDQHGHGVGDEVLIAVAQLISTCGACPGGPPVTIGRWGGEEFIVVLPGTDRIRSEEWGRKLLEVFQNADWPQGLSVTVSVGSSTVRPTDTFTSLLSRADQALYLAKETGRNRIMFDS
jgi:diguanylate cyclase (GGDEF)-like protein